MHNLIPPFIHDKYKEGKLKGNFNALTMFMDISGFTPMTEALMKKGKEGAEILSSILNEVFEPIINDVINRDGFVSVFAGDAMTIIFPFDINDDPLKLCFCADFINRLFEEKGLKKTKFGEFNLSVKLGLSYGNVDWGILGSDVHKTYFFRGRAIDGCAHSEHQCDKMDIIMDKNLTEILPLEQLESEKKTIAIHS